MNPLPSRIITEAFYEVGRKGSAQRLHQLGERRIRHAAYRSKGPWTKTVQAELFLEILQSRAGELFDFRQLISRKEDNYVISIR